MRQELLEIRQRLRDDFPFYTSSALKIRTKNGDISPLNLKEAQFRLNEAITKQEQANQPVRVIVLKARQQGLSTAIGAWIFFRITQRAAQRAIVVTHASDVPRLCSI
jgi:hypothetical protein